LLAGGAIYQQSTTHPFVAIAKPAGTWLKVSGAYSPKSEHHDQGSHLSSRRDQVCIHQVSAPMCIRHPQPLPPLFGCYERRHSPIHITQVLRQQHCSICARTRRQQLLGQVSGQFLLLLGAVLQP
jgi:hypothetical protein